MHTTAQLQNDLHIAREMQDAFQVRLYKEVDKNIALDKENSFLFARNTMLEAQLNDAVALIKELSEALGLDVED